MRVDGARQRSVASGHDDGDGGAYQHRREHQHDHDHDHLAAGTRAEQDAAYRAFTALVASTGAQLVFVTLPPMKRPDEHRDVDHLRSVAAALADEQPGTVHLLDADVVWGPTFVRDIGADGVADRMPDGVHICQGGAMRFADWLTGELADLFDGLRVPAPADWVFGHLERVDRLRRSRGRL